MKAIVVLFIVIAVISGCTADTYECPQGWAMFEQKCFYKNDTVTGPFEKNNDYCVSIGAQMVTIKSISELNFVSYYARYNPYYIGMKKISDVAWRFVDGSIPFSYFWEKEVAEKEKRAPLQPCAIINPVTNRWKDSNCIQQFNFMCEKKATSQDMRKIKEERDRLDKEADRIANELNKTTSDIDDLKKIVDENKKYCETTIVTNVNKVKTDVENKFNIEINNYKVNASYQITKVDEQCTDRTKKLHELIEKNTIDIREQFDNITRDNHDLHNVDIESIKNENQKEFERFEEKIKTLNDETDKCKNDILSLTKEILGLKKEVTTTFKDVNSKLENSVSELEVKIKKELNEETSSVTNIIDTKTDALKTKMSEASKQIISHVDKEYEVVKSKIVDVNNVVKEKVIEQINVHTINVETIVNKYINITNELKVETERIDESIEKITKDLKTIDENDAKNAEKCNKDVNIIQTEVTQLNNTTEDKLDQIEKMIKEFDASLNKVIYDIITTAKIVVNTKINKLEVR